MKLPPVRSYDISHSHNPSFHWGILSILTNRKHINKGGGSLFIVIDFIVPVKSLDEFTLIFVNSWILMIWGLLTEQKLLLVPSTMWVMVEQQKASMRTIHKSAGTVCFASTCQATITQLSRVCQLWWFLTRAGMELRCMPTVTWSLDFSRTFFVSG